MKSKLHICNKVHTCYFFFCLITQLIYLSQDPIILTRFYKFKYISVVFCYVFYTFFTMYAINRTQCEWFDIQSNMIQPSTSWKVLRTNNVIFFCFYLLYYHDNIGTSCFIISQWYNRRQPSICPLRKELPSYSRHWK